MATNNDEMFLEDCLEQQLSDEGELSHEWTVWLSSPRIVTSKESFLENLRENFQFRTLKVKKKRIPLNSHHK